MGNRQAISGRRKLLRATTRLVGMCGLLVGCSATVWASEWSLIKGAQYDLCRALERGIAEHNFSNRWVCETPLPSDDPDFRRPDWQDIDPEANFELVKEIYFWSRLNEFRPGIGDWGLLRRTPVLPQDLMDEVLDPLEDELRAIIQDDGFHLQRAVFDFDHDGEVEVVHRMSTVGRYRLTLEQGSTPDKRFGAIRHFGCSPLESETGQKPYTLYLSFADHPGSFLMSRGNAPYYLDAFLYRGRTYLTFAIGFLVHEPAAIGNTDAFATGPDVCNFEHKEQE